MQQPASQAGAESWRSHDDRSAYMSSKSPIKSTTSQFAGPRSLNDELPALLSEDPESDKEGYDSDDRTDARPPPNFDSGRDELLVVSGRNTWWSNERNQHCAVLCVLAAFPGDAEAPNECRSG